MNLVNGITIQGFKSIKDLKLKFGNINVLIGGNGAGKSNLLSFFEMTTCIGKYELQEFIMQQGGANKVLYNGRKVTNECYFHIDMEPYRFYARMKPSEADGFYFAQQGLYDYIEQNNFYAADGYSELKDEGEISQRRLLSNFGIYHFHDTSVSSLMKATCDINDNLELAQDGRNVAAILYLIKKTDIESYNRILSVIRMVAPYFYDFILRENPLNPQTIRLEWKKKGCDIPFGAEQLSDGTLRFICLATLFGQPEVMRKDIVFVDEPELGLHPVAIMLITELIKKYSKNRQVIAATQSVEFMNEFQPKDIVVVESKDGESIFHRLEEKELEDWLEDYTIGELWRKNVIGGRP